MAHIDPPLLPPRLYRYRKASSLKSVQRELQAILGNYLWFSGYRALNDPMEGIYGASVWLTQQAMYKTLVGEVRDQKRSVGICCFSDTHDNELMWAHYTDNNGGICVEYSTKKLLAGLNNHVHVVRVAYDGGPPRIGEADAQCPRQAARKVLSHKKSCWLYEREWRLLASPETVKIPGALKISTDGAVKAVYFGSRMTDEVRAMLVEHLHRMNIPVHLMQMSGYEHQWVQVERHDR